MIFQRRKQNQGINSNEASGKDAGRGTAITLTLSILLLYFSLAVILNLFGISRKYVNSENLDSIISVEVIHEDQTTTSYSGNIYAPPLKTDTLIATVPLPKNYWISNAMLCFSYYNARIQIFSPENKVIYSSNTATLSADKLTGHMFVGATIPNNCWGRELKIRIDPLEDNTTSVLSGVYLMNSSQSIWYPVLLSGQFTLALILFVFLDSFLFLSFFIIMKVRGSKVTDGILLMIFCLVGTIWALCYTGLMYICSGNNRLCAFGEYYAVYIALPVLTAYFSVQHISKSMKWYFRIFTGILSAYAVAAYIGEANGNKFNIISGIPFLRILLVIVIISCAIVLFTNRGRRDASRFVQNIGLIVTFILVTLEVIRNSFVKQAGEGVYSFPYLAEVNLTMPICIVLVSTLMVSYMSRLMRSRQLEQENEALQTLAKRDSLTGIPNRLFINEALDSLEKSEIHEYVMFFLDANDLKKANDVYGHEYGDKMLQLVGRAIKESADGLKGFYGRYGGDEFVCCLYNTSKADGFEKNFSEIIEKANGKNYLPFKVSVAIGRFVHKETDTKNVEEALKAADDIMYENKKVMKGTANVR